MNQEKTETDDPGRDKYRDEPENTKTGISQTETKSEKNQEEPGRDKDRDEPERDRYREISQDA